MGHPQPRPILLGIPHDASSSFLRGAAAAPPLIRAALHSSASNTWSELGVDVFADGGLQDAGDLMLDRAGRPGAWADAISDAVATLARQGRAPLVLGGDHAITFPVVRGIRNAGPSFAILHVDAHPDLYEEYEGDRLSHACPFARIMEAGLATTLVQVGIRAVNGHQRAQAARFGVDVIDMRRWEQGCRPALDGPVYVSIDLDGLDPAFAPGVSHPEPGGLTVRDVITLVQGIDGPIVGADIVELNPRQDVGGVTACVAAKLVKELAARCLAGGSASPESGP
jgi:agmatinase